MKMTFPQLQSQSLQSVQLVQSGHAFLNERHHPGNINKTKTNTFGRQNIVKHMRPWLKTCLGLQWCSGSDRYPPPGGLIPQIPEWVVSGRARFKSGVTNIFETSRTLHYTNS